MGQVPQEMATKKGEGGLTRGAVATAILCSWLCLIPIGFGEAEPLDDYEFQRIKEAYKVEETAFGLSPEVRDFWEGKEGNGDIASAQTALASQKGSLDNNPFYHLFVGAIYYRQQDKEKAQDEWNKAITLTEDDLFIRWLLLREHCLKKHYEEAERELAEIIRLQAKAGPQRLPMLSSQVVRLAEQLRDRQDLSLALSLINFALHLDSHSTAAGYVKASILWKMSKYNFPEVLKNIVHAVREGFTDERNLYGLSANFLSALVSAYFFLFLMAGAVLFYKYESLLRHEFMERMEIDLRPSASFFLFGFLYLGPIFCFLGWGWLLLFWVFLIFPYSIPKERIILSLLILLLCLLPSLYRLTASLLMAQSDPLIEATLAVQENRGGRKLANFFAKQVEDRPGDPIPHFYFGLLLKNKGELEQAEKELQAAIEHLPNPGAAHNNLANIYFLEERFEEAEDQYRKAIAAEPHVASTHMNLSLLLTLFPERLRIEEAKAESDIAENLEPGITQRMGSYEGPLSERRLLYQYLPEKDLWKRVWAPSRERDLLADSLWGERIRFLPLQALTFFPIFFVLTLWISLRIRIRGPNPRFCQECGQIFCNVCQKESFPEPSCSSCYSVFHLREALNPQLRIDRLIRRDRRGEKEKRKVRTLSFFPGAASLYLGRSWWGMGYAAIFLFLLIYWTGWSKIVPAISPLSQKLAPLGGASLLMLLLLLYGTSLRRGLKWSA
jgi:tetratricopeptide (TPR) repeat protein